MKLTKVLVLGSRGQVGAYLVDYLKEQQHEVLEYDIELDAQHDLRVPNEPRFNEMLHEAEFVFFLAFDVGGSKYLKTHQNTFQFIDNNMLLMHNTFKALEVSKKPFIFASSQMSNMTDSQYGMLKRIGEYYTDSIGGLNVRFWNVYGYETDPEKFHVITDFLISAHNDSIILCNTDGQEGRNFMYGEDCAYHLTNMAEQFDSLMLTLEQRFDTSWQKPILKPIHIDLCHNRWTKIKDVAWICADEVERHTGNKVKVFFSPYHDTTQTLNNQPDFFYPPQKDPQRDNKNLKEGITEIYAKMLENKVLRGR